jgi:hypothetical protein
MTTKEIKKAIKDGRVVAIKDDLRSRICCDFFGQLVVVSLNVGEPTRLATLSDKRKAIIQQH